MDNLIISTPAVSKLISNLERSSSARDDYINSKMLECRNHVPRSPWVRPLRSTLNNSPGTRVGTNQEIAPCVGVACPHWSRGFGKNWQTCMHGSVWHVLFSCATGRVLRQCVGPSDPSFMWVRSCYYWRKAILCLLWGNGVRGETLLGNQRFVQLSPKCHTSFSRP